MLYRFLLSIMVSLLMLACYTPQIISDMEYYSPEIENIKRKEYPGDGAYFASNESDLQSTVEIPIWEIPELVPLEKDFNSNSHTRIIKYAKTYQGTPYKFGGTTKKGMDCSGLVYTTFKNEDIFLPRISSDMAKEGKAIKLQNVQPGDLLFFKTSRRNIINHVGIVVEVSGKDIQFIHSSTSRGVIISSITENYWKQAFTEARRIL